MNPRTAEGAGIRSTRPVALRGSWWHCAVETAPDGLRRHMRTACLVAEARSAADLPVLGSRSATREVHVLSPCLVTQNRVLLGETLEHKAFHTWG